MCIYICIYIYVYSHKFKLMQIRLNQPPPAAASHTPSTATPRIASSIRKHFRGHTHAVSCIKYAVLCITCCLVCGVSSTRQLIMWCAQHAMTNIVDTVGEGDTWRAALQQLYAPNRQQVMSVPLPHVMSLPWDQPCPRAALSSS